MRLPPGSLAESVLAVEAASQWDDQTAVKRTSKGFSEQ